MSISTHLSWRFIIIIIMLPLSGVRQGIRTSVLVDKVCFSSKGKGSKIGVALVCLPICSFVFCFVSLCSFSGILLLLLTWRYKVAQGAIQGSAHVGNGSCWHAPFGILPLCCMVGRIGFDMNNGHDFHCMTGSAAFLYWVVFAKGALLGLPERIGNMSGFI